MDSPPPTIIQSAPTATPLPPPPPPPPEPKPVVTAPAAPTPAEVAAETQTVQDKINAIKTSSESSVTGGVARKKKTLASTRVTSLTGLDSLGSSSTLG